MNILGQPIPPPYNHQAGAFNVSKDMEDFALLMEAGTGKTRVVIDTAAYLFGKGKIDTLVVIAPNGVHRNWLGEVEAHLPGDIPRLAAFYQAGGGKKHQDSFAKTVAYRNGLRILTFNVETLSLESGLKQTLQMIGKRSCLTVIDESQRIKSPSSKRTRNAYKLSHAAMYRRILTGTPVSQGLHDLYSQFRWLNWQIIGCRTFAEFKAMYCVMGGYESREILAYRNVDQLRRKIAPYVFEANKRDCLDLPPETWLTREVELSSEQKRFYKDMRDKFVAELRDNRIEAPLAGVRMLRLRQLLSGFFPLEGGQWENLPCPRLETCADLVEEAARGKVIVWCHFLADIKNVCDKLKERGIGCLPYSGNEADGLRYKNLQQWRTDPNICALVATPATGGVGLTLNEADTDITYSSDYNYEEYVQKNGRNHRSGQTKSVTHYELVARGTADVRMMAVIRKKGNVADMIRNMDRNGLIELFQEAA
jgi:SNF2 family DNA or RNA helicase